MLAVCTTHQLPVVAGSGEVFPFYDLRATGITWEALGKVDVLTIKQRAGHKQISTTLGYVREAETVGIEVSEPFAELPSVLIADTTKAPNKGHIDKQSAQRTVRISRKLVTPTGLETDPSDFEKHKRNVLLAIITAKSF